MIHELKIESVYFEAVKDGVKTFEIRFNDRGYQAGDLVVLIELSDTPAKRETGRRIVKKIGYVLSYAQKENWVVFSLLTDKPDDEKEFENGH